MKFILLLLTLLTVAGAQTTLTIQSAVNLPDATGGPAGEGFTCTGIARHSTTGWWVMNYGVEDPADVTFSSNVVHLSEDFSTNLGEINLSAFTSASVQGVALDTSDNTLWLCIGPNVRNYSEAGVYQSKIISPTGGANGVCYDAANDRLYCMTSSGAFTKYNPNDQTLVSALTSCPASGPDHLCMAPDGVKVWCAAGVNGSDGTVWEYTPGTDSWAQIFTLHGADATEGIVVDGDYIRLMNDAYFHSGTPPENRVLTFQFQPPTWDAPVGIPEPDWGGTTGNPIELARPTFPAPWTSNTTGFYFVTPGGGNGGNGYPGSPRSSIPSNPGAGSVIVLDGTFGATTLDLRGDSSNLVWLTSYDTESPADFTGKVTLGANCTFAVIDNIECNMAGSGNGKWEVTAGVDHICWRAITHNGVAPTNGSSTSTDGSENQIGWSIFSAAGYTTNNLVIYGCDVKDCGNVNYIRLTDEDPDAHCISMQTYVEDVWIVDNTFSYTSGNAVQVGAATTGATADDVVCRQIYIGRNTAHHIAQAAFWAKRSEGVIMSENTCYTLRRDTPSNPDSGGFGGQYAPRNLWIIFNRVYDCENGVTIQGNSLSGGGTATDVWIVGNVFHDIHDENGSNSDWLVNMNSTGGVCVTIRGGADTWVIGNTFYDYDSGIGDATSGNLYASQNAFVSRAEALGGEIVAQFDTDGNNTVSYNAFPSTVYVRAGGSTWTSLSAINAGKSNDNITSTAPSFTNAAGGVFTLAADSDLIDLGGGSAHAVYGDFQTAFGISITYDRAGNARPQGGTWDIGAYEYVSGGGGGGSTAGNVTVTGTLQIGAP